MTKFQEAPDPLVSSQHPGGSAHPLRRMTIPLVILAAVLAGTIASGAAPPPGNSLTLVNASEPGQRLTLHSRVAGAKRPRAEGRVGGESAQPGAAPGLHVSQADAGGPYTPGKPMDEPHARLAGWL